jgi:hypothetical protein
MALLHRQDTIFQEAADGDLQALTGATVTVYDIGAVASQASSGTTITVYAGHGFAIGDDLMVGLDEATFRNVTGTGATSLTVASAVVVNTGDNIVNLGTDGGSSTPSYDGSTISIYAVPDATVTAIDDSRLTTNENGEFSYYYATDVSVWELIRDTAGLPVSINILNSTTLLTSTGTIAANEVARFTSSSGLVIKSGYSSTVTISDAGVINAPGGPHTVGSITTTGAVIVGTSLTVATTSTFSGDVTLSGAGTDLAVGGALSVTGASTLAAITGTTLTATGASTLAAVTMAHLNTSVGAAPVNENIVIGAGWGTGATATVASTGRDNRFQVTVTAGTPGLANPAIVTVTFNTAFTVAPRGVVAMNNTGTGANAPISWATTTTTIAISYKADPVNALTYVFSVLLLG